MRLAVSMLLLAACGSASAFDLSRVDRTIAREPAYTSKPRYLLLVFGAEAKHRVWLVQDGNTLYVDRNGNGDLTEPGEKVAARKVLPGDSEEAFAFEVGELNAGGKTHKGLQVILTPLRRIADNPNLMALPHVAAAVKKSPNERTAMIHLDVECAGRKGGGVGGRVSYLVSPFDTAGVLQLAARPADAPIIHLDGPLQVTFYGSKPTWTGGRAQDTVLCVGTPGSGPGTFAMVKYEGAIPAGKHPTVAVTFPPKDPAQKPIQEHFELKERC